MKRLIVAALLLSSPALAQQQPPDPAFLQRALAAMQTQRNQAMDSAAVLEARLATTADDLAKANARIKEMEAKKQDPSPPSETTTPEAPK